MTLKSNLRNMATIVACLVATMFASCENMIGDDEENGGDGDAAGQIFTSITAMKTWLDSQPDNTVETPYEVGLKNVNLDAGNNWSSVGGAIFQARKYVVLNLKACTGTVFPDGSYNVQYVIVPPPVGGTAPVFTYFSASAVSSRFVRIILPDNLTKMGAYSFVNEKNIRSVVFPTGIKIIDRLSFYGCTNLNDVNFPEGLERIESSAFSSTAITSVTLPASLQYLSSAFSSCKNLKTVTIKQGLEVIGSSTFSGSSSLESVTLPSTVKQINSYAFASCSSLVSVALAAVTPPSLGERVFYNTNSALTIKVPAASVNAYKAHNDWKDHASRIIAN